MPIADWFRKRPNGRATVAIDLGPLEAALAEIVPRLENAEVEPDLVRARLADGYRDAGVNPPVPDAFDKLVPDLDAEAWRRLALAVCALNLPEVCATVPGLVGNAGAIAQVKEAFVGLALATPLLTMTLLRQSPLRVEEFARHFLARLGTAVSGETAAQSRERLERLDYGRLLAEAERAKVSAEERMEYLRQLQEDQARRARRGKW